jgi:hypothetical protein
MNLGALASNPAYGARAVRRLGQAMTADLPAMSEAWVVMAKAAPLFKVEAVVASQTEAEETRDDLPEPEDWLVVGPVAAPQRSFGSVDDDDGRSPACHIENTCEACKEPSGLWPEREEITSVTLTVEAGSTFTWNMNPKVDAIFLTRGARERFLYPHYHVVYGPAYVDQLRAFYGDT